MAQAAAVLGREEDAVRYQEEADKMKRAIRAALITADGVLRYERQGAYVLMLVFGLVPDAWSGQIRYKTGRNHSRKRRPP